MIILRRSFCTSSSNALDFSNASCSCFLLISFSRSIRSFSWRFSASSLRSSSSLLFFSFSFSIFKNISRLARFLASTFSCQIRASSALRTRCSSLSLLTGDCGWLGVDSRDSLPWVWGASSWELEWRSGLASWSWVAVSETMLSFLIRRFASGFSSPSFFRFLGSSWCWDIESLCWGLSSVFFTAAEEIFGSFLSSTLALSFEALVCCLLAIASWMLRTSTGSKFADRLEISNASKESLRFLNGLAPSANKKLTTSRWPRPTDANNAVNPQEFSVSMSKSVAKPIIMLIISKCPFRAATIKISGWLSKSPPSSR